MNHERMFVWKNAKSRLRERAKKSNVEDYVILKNHTQFAGARITRSPSHQ